MCRKKSLEIRLRRWCCLLSLLVSAGCGSSASAGEVAEKAEPAEESGPAVTGGFETDFLSRYVWRGLRYSEGPVLQPTGWVTSRGFTLGVWTNFVLTNEPQQGRFNEVDPYLTYAGHWKQLTIESSFLYYMYPGQFDSPPTGELSFKLAYPVGGGASFFTTHTWDVVQYGGAYFLETGFEWERELNPRTTAEATFMIGVGSGKFNRAYVGPGKNALNVIGLEVGVVHYLSSRIYVKPHLGVSIIVDGRLRDQLEGADTVYAGILFGMDL